MICGRKFEAHSDPSFPRSWPVVYLVSLQRRYALRARPPETWSTSPSWRSCLDHASALSEARFHESVKLGEVLCARSIEPFEGGRWWLRRMRVNGWTRSNGYGIESFSFAAY